MSIKDSRDRPNHPKGTRTMSHIAEVTSIILGHTADTAAKALNQAGKIMPDLPKLTSEKFARWEDDELEITAGPNGLVWIEWDHPSEILELSRAQVLAILAASEWKPQ